MTDPSPRLPAGSFDLDDGSSLTFGDLAGRHLVLYFYPKDSTPGCTREGADFSALHAQFDAAGASIFGVSRDSVASHARFREKQQFPFALISDRDERLCRALDVIGEKNMYGRKVQGVIRSTFLFAPDGNLIEAWRGVKVPGHAAAVLARLQQAAGRTE